MARDNRAFGEPGEVWAFVQAQNALLDRTLENTLSVALARVFRPAQPLELRRVPALMGRGADAR
jgi:hypothetical protein